jgi:GNAT superfamily N-acetyltransferase
MTGVETTIIEVADENRIYPIVDDASRKYRGVIPGDLYHEPYMSMGELKAEMKRMTFFGYRKDQNLLGVMARERIRDATLIRHAYVLTQWQGQGVGSRLLTFIEQGIDTKWLLVGTWNAALWAVDFYRKRGYTPMDDKDDLLRTYWDISERQAETSCVLGKMMSR